MGNILDEMESGMMKSFLNAAQTYAPLYGVLTTQDPLHQQVVVVGDLDSNKLGTAARKNSGKVDLSFIPPHVFTGCLRFREEFLADGAIEFDPEYVMDSVGDWWCGGTPTDLEHAQAMALLNISNDLEESLGQVVEVWRQGAEKYNRYNWMKGMPYNVPFGCIYRHIMFGAYLGENVDKESGQSHWAHVVCNIQMLLHYEFLLRGRGLDLDNRPTEFCQWKSNEK